MSNFSDLMDYVIIQEENHPEWRQGQTLFNCLNDLQPKLANSIRGTRTDPFHVTDINRLDEIMFFISINI